VNILSVAFPLLPVGPGAGGGAEQILYLLERRLAARGHRSFVIAAEGSQISGELIATPAASGEITDAVRTEAQSIHRDLIQRTLQNRPIDLIHFHGLDFHAYVPEHRGRSAMLVTLHLPLSWYPSHIFELPAITFRCVSQNQAASANGRCLGFIPNGVDLSQYTTSRDAEHLLFVGRICPEKGPDIALWVAHLLDLPLLVAGPVHSFPAHEEYFRTCVQPLLDSKRRYVGAIDLAQKVEMLASARAVLIPSLAPETSSLVAMEAAAAGAPVIAYRSGALPEIIVHGKTGFIVESEQQMAEAVPHADSIAAEACQKHAREQFDADRMADRYLELYSRVIQHPRRSI
jgi:glycosyltransferase involved in cell wall biosynthesis